MTLGGGGGWSKIAQGWTVLKSRVVWQGVAAFKQAMPPPPPAGSPDLQV